MTDPLTTVFLDDETAKLFVQFQKRRIMLTKLEHHGFFDMPPLSSIEIHFDINGQMTSCDKHLRSRM